MMKLSSINTLYIWTGLVWTHMDGCSLQFYWSVEALNLAYVKVLCVMGATSIQGYYTRSTLVELKGDCVFYFISYRVMVTVTIIGATFVILNQSAFYFCLLFFFHCTLKGMGEPDKGPYSSHAPATLDPCVLCTTSARGLEVTPGDQVKVSGLV